MAEPSRNQTERPDKAARLLSAATNSLRTSDYEAAVSRAYYAVFQAIHALLDVREAIGTHSTVIRKCAEWNRTYTRLNGIRLSREHRDLHSSLNALYAWRNEADYEVHSMDAQQARRSVEFARSMLEAIRGIVA